jgi:transcriptional regulator with XRE-family HTH domain
MALDVDLLHEYLYKISDRRHRLTVTQRKLAEKLGLEHTYLCKVFRDMKTEGRIKRIGSYYYVVDPGVWRFKK